MATSVAGAYCTTLDLPSLISESAKFIHDHQWVWDIQMTQFFQRHHWRNIPTEWLRPLLELTTDDLNQMPFGLTKPEWPSSLKAYVSTSCSRALCLERGVPSWVRARAVALDRASCLKMTQKKRHEVSHMAGVVEDVCLRTGSSVVLDVGAGLGYLGQLLSQRCGLMVVGLEREEARVASARHRAQSRAPLPDTANTLPDTANTLTDTANSLPDTANTLTDTANSLPDTETTNTLTDTSNSLTDTDTANSLPDTSNSIADSTDTPNTATGSSRFCEPLSALPRGTVSPCHLSIQLTIEDTVESRAAITTLLTELQTHCRQPVRVCVVGLHCCGDLSPAVLSLFSSRVHPSLCSLVLVGCCYHKMAYPDRFTNFPMSACLLTSPPSHPLNVFAMRLASQETRARWRDQSEGQHSCHERNVAFRGMLQAVCGDTELGRMPSPKRYANFEEYAKVVAAHGQQHRPQLQDQLLQYHSLHSLHSPIIEPFTALQVCMQGAMESLVLADRAMFLRERGLSPAVLPLFDELISPRNIAIVTTLPGEGSLGQQ